MRSDDLRLLCVFAHPDDESLGTGGALAKYAAEGVSIFLLTATRGEQGWFGDPDEYPGPEALGKIREGELREACEVLGVREVRLMDYHDGQLDQAEPAEVMAKIVDYVREIRPQVIITFGPKGIYGHPDHIAISQFTTAAVLAAADPDFSQGGSSSSTRTAHRIAKLYYMVETEDVLSAYESAFGDLVMEIDGQERRSSGWEPWAVTTRIDTSQYWQQVWEAVYCHRTQLVNYEKLKGLPEDQQKALWSTQKYYRALSLVNGGRQVESDLFAGLR